MSIETGPRVLGLEVGTQALDVETRGDFRDDPFMGELSASVGPDNIVTETGKPFIEPPYDELMKAHAGGIANAANAIAPVLKATVEEAIRVKPDETVALGLYAWAVMAWLGGDEVGRIWAEKVDPSIDKSLLQDHPDIHYSGLSVIRTQAFETETISAGERAIYFRPGASGATEFTEDDLSKIRERNPFNVNISYPGLFPYGADKSHGQNLAWFVKEAQKVCSCVSMDTHTPTELDHIEPALSSVDMFNANLADAARIFLGETVAEKDVSDDKKMGLYQRMAEVIRKKYFASETASLHRCRMFTITDKKGTYLIFKNPHDSEIKSDYLPSKCASIRAISKTGAGDVRFALQRSYVALMKKTEWENGEFTWEEAKTAVNIGQIGTTLHLQGRDKDTYALNGVSLYALERLAQSENQFTDLQSLKMELAG